MFFTSRKISEISMLFPANRIELEISATEEDVRSYLAREMTNLPSVIRKNQQLQEEIQQAILQSAAGMFLLAELHVHSIKGKFTASAVRAALSNLSTGTQEKASAAYEDAYEKAMQRIQDQGDDVFDFAKQTFLILSHAMRPLRAIELCHALSIPDRPSTFEFDMENVPDIVDVLSVCAGLVIHQAETDIVSEFSKFIRSHPGSYSSQPQRLFLIIALKASEANPSCDWPFLDYASSFYGRHGMATEKAASQVGTSISERITTQLSDESEKPSLTNITKHLGFSQLANELGVISRVLVWACENRNHNLVGMLLEPGLPQIDDQLDESLEVAARLGDSKITSLLLEHGANPVRHLEQNDSILDVHSESDIKNLHRDSKRAERIKWRYKIASGRRTPRSRIANSPLSLATFHGHTHCLQIILNWMEEHSSNWPEAARQQTYAFAILSAIAGKNYQYIPGLLALGCSIDSVSAHLLDPTLFHLVCRWGELVPIQMMLDHGAATEYGEATLTTTDIMFETVLNWLITNGMQDVVRDILNRPTTNFNAHDEDGHTLLSIAIRQGNVELLQLLLERSDLDINKTDNTGRTPLSQVPGAFRPKSLLEHLLQRQDIDPNTPDLVGRTPLPYAAEVGFIHAHESADVFSLLLQTANIKPDDPDANGRTPLSYAAEHGIDEVVSLLLQCANINADCPDAYGRTPLSWAAGATLNKNAVRSLLRRKDVDPDSRDVNGRSVLSWAVSSSNDGLVKLLLERKEVDADSRDCNGRSPLSWAAPFGTFEVMRTLLARNDIDQGQVDNFGRTPSFYVLRCDDIWKRCWFFLGTSNRLDEKDDRGCTLWHTLISPPLSELQPENQSEEHTRCRAAEPQPNSAPEDEIDPAVLEVLLQEAWLQAHIPDNAGLTPLHHALMRAFEHIGDHAKGGLYVAAIEGLYLRPDANADFVASSTGESARQAAARMVGEYWTKHSIEETLAPDDVPIEVLLEILRSELKE
ncbi:hypothetical protein PG996_011821 [Apiospora saccharicola]|uniref:Ankyrin n=1 Tax=Apiospora saccharicola TaxID=335842 RepID=A0ABR1UG69_9PEZI